MNLTLKQPTAQAGVAKAGAIPVLVEMLSETEGQMEEVAGALTNLADTNEDNHAEIAKAGAVPPLVKLLAASASPSCQEEASGTLMNLAACEANKAKIVSAGAIPPLVKLLSTGTDCTKEHAAGTLANLANGHDNHQATIGKAGAVGALMALVAEQGEGANLVAARAVSALLLLCLNRDNAEAVHAVDGIAKLTAALKRGVSEAAGALMNLSLHSKEAQRAILNGGALPCLVEMLSASTPTGQEEAAGAIMNLTTGSPENQKPVADAGAVLPLVMLLTFGASPSAKEHAAAALGNLAQKNEPIRKSILAAQAGPALLEMLKATDAKAAPKGAKQVEKASGKKTGGLQVEAANCLRNLLEGDSISQAVLVEEGMLLLLTPLLKAKATEEAGSKLLGALDECFDDLVATAKSK